MFYFGKLMQPSVMQDIKNSCDRMTRVGQSKFIKENSEKLGLILQTSELHKGQPVFVSQGHNISLYTASNIVKISICGPHRRLPEPIFISDLISRKTVIELERNQNYKWKNFIENNNELTSQEKEYWIRNIKK